jgi:gamma-glutamylcyclotransferase (GGCT)/AIG2-like uncharacterized protein YtfP
MITNLFVYGTLRRGGPLHGHFSDKGISPIGIYTTYPIYTLYDCGCPCLSELGSTSIVGEVYRVDIGDILDVHTMELYAGYTFKPVQLLDFNENAYAYFQSPSPYMPDPKIIESGDYIKYRYDVLS